MITVEIKLLSEKDKDRFGIDSFVRKHRGADKQKAIEKTVREMFGNDCWFDRDMSMPWDIYGQVRAELNPGLYAAQTGRVRIDVTGA